MTLDTRESRARSPAQVCAECASSGIANQAIAGRREGACVDADDLLVGTDHWRMASLAVERNGSVTMSVVPIPPVPCARCVGRPAVDATVGIDAQQWTCRGENERYAYGYGRFFCDEPTCLRRIFAERFMGLLRRYSRRTEEATGSMLAFGQRAGGEAGARLSRTTGIPTSPDTLRRLRERRFVAGVAPERVGVDDFAFRRRQHYGLILVDLAVEADRCAT